MSNDQGHGGAMVRAGMEASNGAGGMIRKSGDVGAGALAAAAVADVQARFLLARSTPRSEDDAAIRILNACKRPAFAAPPGPGKQVAMYSRPVGGQKNAEGLSVHAAREFRRLWGNIETTIKLIFEDDAQEVWNVATTDLEVNFRRAIDVPVTKSNERKHPKGDVLRSRLNSYGETVYIVRAEGDELTAKRGKAIAIAERETILAMLPGDLKEEAIATIKDTQQRTDAKDPAAARKAVCDSFAELGIMPKAIEEQYLGHPLEQTTPAEFGELRGVYAALRSGDVSSWAAVCAAKKGEETGDATLDAQAKAAKAALDAAKQKIGAKAGKGKPAAPTVTGQPPQPAAATTLSDEQKMAAIDQGREPGGDG